MSELSAAAYETGELFTSFFDRYKRLYTNPDPPSYLAAENEETIISNFLHHIETEGPRLTLYHGTHSGYIDAVAPRKLFPPFFLAVSSFQSAQFALQRAWTETKRRRLTDQSEVRPVLYEVHIDLRDLEYEIVHPSPDVHVTKNIGIGVTQDPDNPARTFLSEVQLVGKDAEHRLQMGSIDIVASGSNLIQLLQWSREHIGAFNVDILLPKKAQ